jgi:HK97 gp10 family phage protein
MPTEYRWNGKAADLMVKDSLARVLIDAGRQAVEKARQLAPVDTGNLRESIGYRYEKAAFRIVLYAKAFYAEFVEMGTSKTRAQPFIRPTLAEMNKFLGNAVKFRGSFPSTPDKYGGAT